MNLSFLIILVFILCISIGKIKTTPEQIRIGVNPSNLQSMFISWVDFDNNVQNPFVKYYLQNKPSDISTITQVNTTEYYLSDQKYTSPKLFSVLIPNLIPNSLYFYSVGSSINSSSWKSFRANPSLGPEQELIINVVGDIGATEHSKEMANGVLSVGPFSNITIHTGDLSYADNFNDNQTVWDEYGNIIESFASQFPYMPAVGNHEEAENFVPFSKRYHMDFFQHASNGGNFYYSFDYANIHFISLSSQNPYDPTSPQYKWLINDLKNVKRSITPWIIAMWHIPFYNSNDSSHLQGEKMRKSMESILFENSVDIVFNGHVHAYERCARIYDFKINPKGPMYIVVGDGGNPEGLAMKWRNPQPDWSLFRKSEWGFGTLHIFNSTTAEWKWFLNEDSNGPHDLVLISRS